MDTLRTAGPIEFQLQELWLNAKNRAYLPNNWFKFLELKRRFDLNFILYKDIKIKVPSGKIPNCEDCEEICCTGPNSIVSLRLRDIAAFIDAGLTKHITHERPRLSLLGNVMSEARKDNEASIFSQVFPVLTQDKTNTCTLLDENRLCTAYPNWPLSCARYPYAIDVANKIIFYAKGCGSYNICHPSEVTIAVRNLVTATIDSYNERIQKILLIYFAENELRELGLLTFLRMDRIK
ncbi:MAG: YkgJ family cysteine cluster protein [bacterium]|nr:YkgJ family cysteine cluster protein [bacterium]